jgi:leader peptidase (prepilin peptidase)/N-methyltransferase
MSVLIIIFIFVFGLILGSFTNALIWRLQQLLDDDGNNKKLSAKQKAEYSIFTGRSMCPSCKHTLSTKDLVPVFSWLSLKGKCRYCHNKISKQYPAVELAMGLLFVVSYLLWPFSLNNVAEYIYFAGYLFTLVCLVAMAIYDHKTYILPSQLIYSAIGIFLGGLIIYSVLSGNYFRLGLGLLSAFTYFAIFFSIYIVSYVLFDKGKTKQTWLGFGDVRLAFLLGLMVGSPVLVLFAIFSASLVGIIYTMPSIINKKIGINTMVPFGPFLIAGAIIAIFWGQIVLNWYVGDILQI